MVGVLVSTSTQMFPLVLYKSSINELGIVNVSTITLWCFYVAFDAWSGSDLGSSVLMLVSFVNKLDSFCLLQIPISILPSRPTPRHLSLISASLLAICIPVPQMSSKLDSTSVLFSVYSRLVISFLFCRNF